ncbi:MAG: hypothetical protein MUC49_22055 [Raineya sp.]|jgi:hypothetical protein|nr:hypothetical protein [Raineya sp.]
MQKTDAKKCPECGRKVEGRANKIYCSGTCKKKAHLEGKTHALEPSVEKIISAPEKLSPKETKEMLELKLTLQRENQKHQKEMKMLEIQKEMELKKMEFENEEKRRGHTLEVEKMRYGYLETSEEEVEEEIEEEVIEEEEQEEQEQTIELPQKAIKLFKKVVKIFLKDDQETFQKDDFKEKLALVTSLKNALEEWAERKDVDLSEEDVYLGCVHLEEVYQDIIGEFGIFTRTKSYDITQETYDYYQELLENL